MKIFDLLDNKDLGWTTDSCDVWIEPTGKIHDLGTENCHLQYIKEHIGDTKDTADLIGDGWVKITNTKNKVAIQALSNALDKHKRLFVPVILEKAKTQEFELSISITNQQKTISLMMPKEQSKLITLI